jgi:hypothetical protein
MHYQYHFAQDQPIPTRILPARDHIPDHVAQIVQVCKKTKSQVLPTTHPTHPIIHVHAAAPTPTPTPSPISILIPLMSDHPEQA